MSPVLFLFVVVYLISICFFYNSKFANILFRGGVSVGAVGAIAPTVSEEIPIGA